MPAVRTRVDCIVAVDAWAGVCAPSCFQAVVTEGDRSFSIVRGAEIGVPGAEPAAGARAGGPDALWSDEDQAAYAAEGLRACFELGDEPVLPGPIVLERMGATA